MVGCWFALLFSLVDPHLWIFSSRHRSSTQIYEEFRQFAWNCLLFAQESEPFCGFCLFVFKWGEYKTRLD